jgi:hypothetical protein
MKCENKYKYSEDVTVSFGESYFVVLQTDDKGKIIPCAGHEGIWGHCR